MWAVAFAAPGGGVSETVHMTTPSTPPLYTEPEPPAGALFEQGEGEGRLGVVARAGARGAVAAMAMTGMRAFTKDVGIVEQPPPEAIVKQKARGLMRRVPRTRRVAAIELVHWSYGVLGGAVFGSMPDAVRRQAWSGPAYGLLVWLGFEAGLAPMLGLKQAKRLRVAERAALAADHLLYGLVVAEPRRPGS
jgi:hypothetical protein